MSVALLSTAVVLLILFLLSYFIFHACYVRALVDTLQYAFKLLKYELASRSHAKTGFCSGLYYAAQGLYYVVHSLIYFEAFQI